MALISFRLSESARRYLLPSKGSPFLGKSMVSSVHFVRFSGIDSSYSFACCCSGVKIEAVSMDEEKTDSRRRFPADVIPPPRRRNDVKPERAPAAVVGTRRRKSTQQPRKRATQRRERGYCEMCGDYFDSFTQVCVANRIPNSRDALSKQHLLLLTMLSFLSAH